VRHIQRHRELHLHHQRERNRDRKREVNDRDDERERFDFERDPDSTAELKIRRSDLLPADSARPAAHSARCHDPFRDVRRLAPDYG
jgi:hypothetical protein